MKNFKLVIATLLAALFLLTPLTAFAATAPSDQPKLVEFWVGKNDYVIDGLTKKGCLYTVPFLENGRVCMEILELRSILGFAEEKQSIPLNEDVVILPNGAVCASIMGAVGTAYSVEYSGQEEKVTLRLAAAATQSPVANAPATSTPPSTALAQPIKTETHEPADAEWKITGTTSAVATVWNATAADKNEYKYLIEGDKTFPKGSGGMLYYYASLEDAKAAYNANALPAGANQPATTAPTDNNGQAATTTPATVLAPTSAPTKGKPIQVTHEPNEQTLGINSQYWAVAVLWNRSAEDTTQHKYLLSADQLHSFPTDAGGAIWFFHSEKEARDAYESNPVPKP